jgi:expansin (peptidoglycan-binding protein)
MFRRFASATMVSVLLGAVGSCAPPPPVEYGGGSGGHPNGSGGSSSGGATGSGGSGSGGSTTGSGGSSSGGSTGSGGDTTSSGGSSSGGATGSGGASSGGTMGDGGRGSGGAASGGSGAGGRGTAGSGTAGRGSGGGSGAGGRGSGGSGSGGSGAGTGGAMATACNLPNHSGMGSFTHYYFGMGTGKDGSGYRPACGYYGTEGGSSASGPNDTVQNIASMSPASATYFAAIPGQNGFDTRLNCGACVQITGQNGTVIVATVADECPYGNDGGNSVCGGNASGHLDLSTAAFDRLGYSRGDPTGTNWKFVPCPVTGNVMLQIKNGNNNEVFIQNSILAIKAVSRGSENASMQKYGAWHFGSALNNGDTLTLTDASMRTLQVQVKSTAMGQNQDTGLQFAKCQ